MGEVRFSNMRFMNLSQHYNTLPVSCLVLGLVRWPVVSVPTVLDAQGGYSAWEVRGHNSVGKRRLREPQHACSSSLPVRSCVYYETQLFLNGTALVNLSYPILSQITVYNHVSETCRIIRVVHGSHSWAIFSSFSNSFSAHFCVFGKETNKRKRKMG